MRLLFRILSLFALSVSVIMAVIDATRSVASSTVTFTPLIQSWRTTWPDLLNEIQRTIQEDVSAYLWDPVLTSLLTLPGWLIFAVLALVFYALGYRRTHADDRILSSL